MRWRRSWCALPFVLPLVYFMMKTPVEVDEA